MSDVRGFALLKVLLFTDLRLVVYLWWCYVAFSVYLLDVVFVAVWHVALIDIV